jgi:hypothetical protein
MTCTALEQKENPFCAICLPERVAKTSSRDGIHWRTEGNYVIPEAPRKRLPNAHKRQHQAT